MALSSMQGLRERSSGGNGTHSATGKLLHSTLGEQVVFLRTRKAAVDTLKAELALIPAIEEDEQERLGQAIEEGQKEVLCFLRALYGDSWLLAQAEWIKLRDGANRVQYLEQDNTVRTLSDFTVVWF